MSIEFRSLASSSAGCCYIVSGGGCKKPLMIDAGIRFAQIQIATDFNTAGMAGALISHSHGDHCLAVPDLITKGSLDCFMSSECASDIMAMKNSAPFIRSRLKAVPLMVPFMVGEWRVTAFNVEHDKPGTLGFVVDSLEGDRLLYVTDTGFIRYTFEGLTHIAIEANFSEEILRRNVDAGYIDPERFKRTYNTHMSIERVIDMLKANDLSKVEVIHLLHLSNTNSDPDAFAHEVQKATGIPTYICATNSLALA